MLVVPILLPDADLVFYPSLLSQWESDRLLTELTQTIDWRQDSITIYGRSLPQPRLTAWYGDVGKSYTYSGITMQPTPWTATLLDLKATIDAISGQTFNSVLLNLYRDGNDSMGWHSDNEPELGPNPVIGSLSLGGTRRFMLRHRQQKDLKHQIELTSGSFLLMQGTTQHYWQHQIPKTKRSVPPRINLTFRVICSHSPVTSQTLVQMAIAPTDIKQCLLQKVRERGLEKSICPSEVARALAGEAWRSLMLLIRTVGAELVADGMVVALQRGQVVDPLTAKGPIRFRVTQQGMDRFVGWVE
jgi:alkylated DNA repair dioxygenase AlkB